MSDLFVMVNCAVVHDYDTAWTGIRIEGWSLVPVFNCIGRTWSVYHKVQTSSLFKNCRKRSLFTEPSNMSKAMIPSMVKAGRMEYR